MNRSLRAQRMLGGDFSTELGGKTLAIMEHLR
jgi:hypothetical protein